MNNYNFNDENFKNTEIYKNFIKENPTTGILNIRAYSANQAIPVAGLNIVVSSEYNNANIVFFTGQTNNSGVIENIILPAPALDSSNLSAPNKTSYIITATLNGQIDETYKINMYENISVIQNINIGPQTLQVGAMPWQ